MFTKADISGHKIVENCRLDRFSLIFGLTGSANVAKWLTCGFW